MKISLIIPAFNVENYIYECLNSLIEQNNKELEFIVINDGSNDNTVKIVDDFFKEYDLFNNKNWKLINQENKGLSITRNNGIKHAQGEFLFFLDADDILANNALVTLLDILNQNKSIEMIIFTADCFGLGSAEEISSKNQYYARNEVKEGIYTGVEFYKGCTNVKKFVASACLYIVKKEIILNNGILFYPNIIHEDELFTRRLLINITSVLFIRQTLYLRRIREGSITTSPIKLSKVNSYMIISKYLNGIEFYSEDSLLFYKLGVKYFLLLEHVNISMGLKILLNPSFLKIDTKKKVFIRIVKRMILFEDVTRILKNREMV